MTRRLLVLHAADVEKTRRVVKRHMGVFTVDELDRFVDEVRWRKKAEELRCAF